MRAACLMLSLVAMSTAAAQTPIAAPAAESARARDETSYAEPDKVRITDLALDLEVDFDDRRLRGHADLTLAWTDVAAADAGAGRDDEDDKRDDEARTLALDTRDLDIRKAEGRDGDGKWKKLDFELAKRDAILGSKLTIEMPQPYTQVRIEYRTSPEASGLQWLTPAMTQGGKLPFMFSQSQAIHARSWVPLQDTPSVRFTYSAKITTPKDVIALMSADNDPVATGNGTKRDGEYTFRMPQPVPSYLLAIAAGDLVFEPISARAGVWAEPAMAKQAAQEFADTEKMIVTTEGLYGPYRWGRYDILVLPPSFPFGGMENPRLTFATPTVIVGDRSLVSLIAHELAHSWSGNLVTNASWKDIWLNEGFTSYVENRIVEAVFGKEQAAMEDVISQNGLKQELAGLKPEQQLLALPPLTGADPDVALTDVAYIKGAWFLSFLEGRYGRETFDAFLRGWFDAHAFQSVSTDQFVDYLQEHLVEPNPDKATREELDAWLHQPGIPSFAQAAHSERFDRVDAAREAWVKRREAARALSTTTRSGAKWSTQEWVHFLEGMPEDLSPQRMNELDAAFHFTGTPNGEIAQRWYPLAVRSGYFEARPAMAQFLKRIGRRKLIMPTYEELAKTDDGLKFARQVFAAARPGYHPITSASVQAALDKAESGKD